MEQKKKNIRLLIVLIVLAAITITLYLIPIGKGSSINNAGQFQLKDTSGITSIVMKSSSFQNELNKTDSGWTINDKYLADESMVIVLFSVMERVEVLRKIKQDAESDVPGATEPIQVMFEAGDKDLISFVASSNPTKTLSIFSHSEESFIVNIPGYDSFVSGIFEIPESDWRSRLIVSMGPLNMDAIKVNYLKNPDKSFEVSIQNNFPNVTEIESTDTLKLMDFLEQFSYFQVDQYLARGDNQVYDSISGTNPWIEFHFEEVDSKNNVTLSFYHKLPNEPNILGNINGKQLALFNYRRIAGIFMEKGDFARK